MTKKEIESGSGERLRECLEQLDIKYIQSYEQHTTHVVSKKRNTSKTLQALISGKPIVSDGFVSAIAEAAAAPDDEGTPSALEDNFDEAWPNAADYLPPRGDEPTERPPADYAPDERRQDVFAGYSFVFYNQKQHDNLAPVIQLGQGKTFCEEVVEGVTEVDDFVRYVKEVAGEKGTGTLDDAGEGKRVVVVRRAPGKGEDVEWWTNFYTSFARHLDHRPPDQSEFLEAILACDASKLRRHLEEETQPTSTANPTQKAAQIESEDRMQVDEPEKENEESAPPRRRARAVGRSRFKGFDLDSDSDDDKSTADIPARAAKTATQPAAEIPESQGSQSLFVSQRQDPIDDDASEQESRPTAPTRSARSQPKPKPTRKRALSPLPEHDVGELLDSIAPTAAAAKRRRIEAGQPAIPEPTPEPEEPPAGEDDKEAEEDSPKGKGKKGETKGKGKKGKKKEESEIIQLARQRREEAEALAAAERQALLDATNDDDIDYAAIRRLHIIEEFEVKRPSRDLDLDEREAAIADGRWDPRWNGRRNFKKFRKQRPGENSAGGDAAVAEQPRRPVITLEEVKPRDHGMGDDYWLEDTGTSSRRNTQTQTQGQGGGGGGGGQSQSQAPPRAASQNPKSADTGFGSLPTRRMLMAADSSDSDADSAADDDPPPPYSAASTETAAAEPSRSRAGKAAEKAAAAKRAQQTAAATAATQSGEVSSGSGAGSKHGAPASGSGGPAAKRRRFEAKDSDEDNDSDSDDGLKFRFRRRK